MAVMTALAALGVSTPTSADLYVGAGGAPFFPHHGDTGFGVLGQVAYGSDSGVYRTGLEYEYREFNRDGQEIFFETDPDFELHAVRLIGQIHPYPAQHLSPYLGAGISYVHLDIRAVYHHRPGGRSVGKKDKNGFGFVLLAGLETQPFEAIPVLLFAEGRWTADFIEDGRVNDEGDKPFNRNLGGLSTWLGLRLRF
ncbi:MAG: hypothetical protein GY946_24015 [bacterium]|nr:hypothetical protein [bacterium]